MKNSLLFASPMLDSFVLLAPWSGRNGGNRPVPVAAAATRARAGRPQLAATLALVGLLVPLVQSSSAVGQSTDLTADERKLISESTAQIRYEFFDAWGNPTTHEVSLGHGAFLASNVVATALHVALPTCRQVPDGAESLEIRIDRWNANKGTWEVHETLRAKEIRDRLKASSRNVLGGTTDLPCVEVKTEDFAILLTHASVMSFSEPSGPGWDWRLYLSADTIGKNTQYFVSSVFRGSGIASASRPSILPIGYPDLDDSAGAQNLSLQSLLHASTRFQPGNSGSPVYARSATKAPAVVGIVTSLKEGDEGRCLFSSVELLWSLVQEGLLRPVSSVEGAGRPCTPLLAAVLRACRIQGDSPPLSSSIPRFVRDDFQNHIEEYQALRKCIAQTTTWEPLEVIISIGELLAQIRGLPTPDPDNRERSLASLEKLLRASSAKALVFKSIGAPLSAAPLPPSPESDWLIRSLGTVVRATAKELHDLPNVKDLRAQIDKQQVMKM